MTPPPGADVQHLADHPLLFALPVLIPTLIVVVLVALVVVRDRRRGELDDLDLDPSDPRRGAPQSGPDGIPPPEERT